MPFGGTVKDDPDLAGGRPGPERLWNLSGQSVLYVGAGPGRKDDQIRIHALGQRPRMNPDSRIVEASEEMLPFAGEHHRYGSVRVEAVRRFPHRRIQECHW